MAVQTHFCCADGGSSAMIACSCSPSYYCIAILFNSICHQKFKLSDFIPSQVRTSEIIPFDKTLGPIESQVPRFNWSGAICKNSFDWLHRLQPTQSPKELKPTFCRRNRYCFRNPFWGNPRSYKSHYFFILFTFCLHFLSI